MKKIFFMLLLLAILSSCSPGNNTSQDIKKDVQDTGKKVEAAREWTEMTYLNNKVIIHYPQLLNEHNGKKEKHINDIIKAEATKVLNYYPDAADELTIEINSVITYQSEALISIQYKGLGIVLGTAHPNNHFYTTIVDIEKGSRLKLTDVVTIDDSFVEAFKKDSKPVKPLHEEILARLSTEELLHDLQESDSLDHIGTENQTDIFSYLTKDSLGISIPVSHAEGDHALFEIKYVDIKHKLKLENHLLEDVVGEK